MLKNVPSILLIEMVKFASDILSNRENISVKANDKLTYSQLGSGYDYWLMKFDNVSKNGDHGLEDKPEYTLIEYAYYLMAKSCGITMNVEYTIQKVITIL